MSDVIKLRVGDNSILPKVIEGISPEVELTQQADGVLMTVTTKSGVKSALIPRGQQGLQGIQGIQGRQGEKGEKGDAYQLTSADIEEIKDKYDDVKADILAAARQVAEDKAVAAGSATAAASSATAAARSAASAANNQQQTADLVEIARQYANQVTDAVDDAEASAQRAAEYESDASGAVDRIEELTEGFEEAVQTAADMIDGAETTALGNISAAQTGALSEISDAKSDALEAIGSGVDAAVASATAAAGSATAAAGSATAAAGSATTAATSAQEAAQIAAGIETSGAAQVAAIEAKGAEVIAEIPADYSTLSDDVNSLKSAFNELPDIYAKQDWGYENLTSGNALEVLSDRGTSDTEPYTFRKALGWNRAMVKAVTGGSLPWNQLVNKNEYYEGKTVNGVTLTTDKTTGEITVSGTATADTSLDFMSSVVQGTKGHIMYLYQPSGAKQSAFFVRTGEDGFWNYKVIGIWNGTGKTNLRVLVKSGQTVNLSFKPQLFDLTLMFGSTIADYIYSIEQATAGAGVALFRSWFPNDYYAYNPGELISVNGLQSGETVGFNQWDEEFEIGGINDTTGEKVAVPSQKRSKNFIKTVSGQNYYLFASGIGTGGVWVYLYDSSYAFIGRARASSYNIANTIFSTPDNCQYMLFKMQPDNAVGQTVKICINISDPSRNGTYKPYVKHSYPLDSSLTLRGVPNLVDNKLAFDGDRYLPDGTVERRYGIVDLGTLNYTIYNHATLGQYFYANIASLNVKRAGVYVNVKFPAVCAKYAVTSRYQSAFVDKCLCFDGDATKVTELQIKDSSYNNAADFKASLSGVYLVYELATPTSETAEPYRNLQIQEKGGTEAFVSNAELPVPVGHETFYPIIIFDYIDQAIAAALNA